MTGETKAEVSGWTVDTLHALVTRMLAERDARYEQRFNAQEMATRDRDRFLDHLAAEREKQVSQALRSAEEAVRKAEAATEKRFEGVNEFRQTLADQARDLMPRLETEQLVRAIEQKIGDLNGRLNTLQSRVDNSSARGSGREQLWGYILGAVGLVGAVVAIVFAFAAK